MEMGRPMSPFIRAAMASGGSFTPPMEAAMTLVGAEMHPMCRWLQIPIRLIESGTTWNEKGSGIQIKRIPEPFFCCSFWTRIRLSITISNGLRSRLGRKYHGYSPHFECFNLLKVSSVFWGLSDQGVQVLMIELHPFCFVKLIVFWFLHYPKTSPTPVDSGSFPQSNESLTKA